MFYRDAEELFKQHWLRGFNKGTCTFPYDLRYDDDIFIITIVPTVDCLTQRIDQYIVDKYVKKMQDGQRILPAWVAYGKRLRDKVVHRFDHGMLFVLDGNHRTTAKRQQGHTSTDVIIPKSNYELYVREYGK